MNSIRLYILPLLIVLISTVTVSADTGRIEKLTVGTTSSRLKTAYVYCLGYNWAGSFTHESLLIRNASGKLEPLLAESWDVSDGMRTWTFHLVKDAIWHDGRKLTAHDVKFTVEYHMAHNKYKANWRNLVSIEALDDHTIVTRLKKPDYTWLAAFGCEKVLPKHIWQHIKTPYKFRDFTKTSMGSGPYLFDRYDEAAGLMRWKVNPLYRKGRANIDCVDVRYFGNEDIMVMALNKGLIDVTMIYAGGISFFNVPKLERNKDIIISTIPGNGISNNLWFNTKKAPYDDVRFRQAVVKAVNYSELKTLFTSKYGADVRAGWLPEKGYPHYKKTALLEYDLDGSKRLLDQIGYRDSDRDGFRNMPDGSDFQPTLMVRGDLAENRRVADRLAAHLKKAGIDLKIKLIDRSSFFGTIEDSENFDMFIARTTYMGMVSYGGYGTGYVDDREYGWAAYTHKKFQGIADRLHTTLDENQRKTLIHELMDHYAGHVPVAALYNMDIIQPYHGKYKGYVDIPKYGVLSHDTWFNLKKQP